MKLRSIFLFYSLLSFTTFADAQNVTDDVFEIAPAECPFPLAGSHCQNHFLNEHKYVMFPLLGTLSAMLMVNVTRLFLIAFYECKRLKKSKIGLSFQTLRRSYKFMSSISFVLAGMTSLGIWWPTFGLCPICLNVLKISFPSAALLFHDGVFYLALLFFQVEGLLNDKLKGLVYKLMYVSSFVFCIPLVAGFGLNLSGPTFVRVQFSTSGIAFFLNFALIEVNRKDILEQVEKIKSRAQKAAAGNNEDVPVDDPSLILERKVVKFLSGTRLHLPGMGMFSFTMGLTPFAGLNYWIVPVNTLGFLIAILCVQVFFIRVLGKTKARQGKSMLSSISSKLKKVSAA